MVNPIVLARELGGVGVEQHFQVVRELVFRCMEEENQYFKYYCGPISVEISERNIHTNYIS